MSRRTLVLLRIAAQEQLRAMNDMSLFVATLLLQEAAWELRIAPAAGVSRRIPRGLLPRVASAAARMRFLAWGLLMSRYHAGLTCSAVLSCNKPAENRIVRQQNSSTAAPSYVPDVFAR